MNSEQIDKALRSDDTVNEVYVRTFPADLLPNPKEFSGAYIANTQPSHISREHWVAFYCDNNKVECFDSYVKNPSDYSDYIVIWVDDEYQVVQIEVLQADDSTVCGQYCMFFVLVRAYGFSYQDILSALSSDSSVNDKIICRFINTFFKLRTVLKDKKFWISRLLKRK